MYIADVSNTANVIDSRDVIARIEELEALRAENIETMENGTADDEIEDFTREDAEELKALTALADEGEGVGDWSYGATLVRDDYFEDYARQVAEDLGMITSDYQWPASHIDWEAAADSLRMDYTSVEFEGVTFWVR